MSHGMLTNSLLRSVALLNSLLLATALAIASPTAERSLSVPSGALPPQELIVTSNLTDQEVDPNFVITLNLSRPLPAAEGRVAVLIGQTDFTNLFMPAGNSLSYLPRIVPLPAGESPVRIFLVSPSNEWRELTQLTLRVKAPALADAPQAAGQIPPPAADPARPAAATKYSFTPSLTLGMKSQMAESHFPASNRPERSTFTDLTLQASLKSEIERQWFKNQAQFDIVGSSYQKEALRFAERGAKAPQVDLSSYLMQFQMGAGKLQFGHTSFGTNRHLINGYGSRGLTFTMPLGRRSDLSLAALNGTSTVGWSNFFGLNRRKHQLISATLGFEALPNRPGGLRLEVAGLSGSLLPIAGFNQGVINDAERSDGASLRLAATDKAQRLKFEGGFTRSRFNNPADSLLNQNLPVIATRETARNAHYLDTSIALLKDMKLSEKKSANLTLNIRHERVAPLFRSVAASTQADRFQNEIEMIGGIGEITATVAHQRFHDNLNDIPSLLRTQSRRYAVMVSVPLASFGTNMTDGTDGTSGRSIWLPRLAYNLNLMSQLGREFPGTAGFDSSSQVPDQISENHEFVSEWQFQKWRLTYRFNRSFQDNRQTGRETADLRNLINGVTFGFNPRPDFDLNFDLNIESAKNFEIRRVDRTIRAGVNTNWHITPKMTINAIVSNTLARDLARTSRNRNTEFDLQWSYKFTRGETGWRKVQGQFFIRYADRYARMRDFVFGLDNLTRLSTLNTGINIVFF